MSKDVIWHSCCANENFQIQRKIESNTEGKNTKDREINKASFCNDEWEKINNEEVSET